MRPPERQTEGMGRIAWCQWSRCYDSTEYPRVDMTENNGVKGKLVMKEVVRQH